MKLTIVMPVYNEEKSIELVIKEWDQTLESIIPGQFRFLIIDDGSTDRTTDILEGLSETLNHLIHHRKENSGHGESCLTGYKQALELNSDWILQIDSDYQCDPAYFNKFWDTIHSSRFIMGKRVKRHDGHYRLIITRLISLWFLLTVGKYCQDPNVPYRLMRKEELSILLPNMKTNSLFNMFLSYEVINFYKIEWIDIQFRKRLFGNSFHKLIPTFSSIFKLTIILLLRRFFKRKVFKDRF